MIEKNHIDVKSIDFETPESSWIHRWNCACTGTVLAVLLFAGTVHTQPVIDISDERQLFVDYFLIEQLSNVQLRMHTPTDEGTVLYFDKPWEGPFSAYCTVIKDSSQYRLYYRGLPTAGADGNDQEVTCYAQSSDGKSWTKPSLGIHSYGGSKKNNIILANAAPVTHNFSPFLDRNPAAKPSARFKAIGGTKKSGLIAYTSADGIHWQPLKSEPIFTEGIFDSQNVVFWSESERKYVCYFRTWTGDGYSGFRSVGRTTSQDFIHWTPGIQMEFGSAPLEHLYTQQTSPYFRAPQIYIAIGARFMPNRQVLTPEQAQSIDVDPKYYQDCSDAYFMTSRGGGHFDRTFLESYLRPGIGMNNWVSRSNYPGLNIVPTGPSEMSIYVNEHYAQKSAQLKRYAIRMDGFTSVSAGYAGGTLSSKLLTFSGNHLEINFSTSAAGYIKIELRDNHGTPIPGFSLSECDEIIGNEISRLVSWSSQKNLSQLSGQPITIFFEIQDADLYSFRFF